jgi:hypothetical protein
MPLFDLNRMKKFLPLAILVLCFTGVGAQSKRIGAYRFQVSKNNHTATVVIRNEPFDSSTHKVGYDNNVGNLVDGRKAYGAEAVPQTQIKSIVFSFDGKFIKVPRSLYADCYNPNLEHRYVNVRFGRNLQSVLVTMWGADGAGAYGVVWILKTNGRHARYFRDAF